MFESVVAVERAVAVAATDAVRAEEGSGDQGMRLAQLGSALEMAKDLCELESVGAALGIASPGLVLVEMAAWEEAVLA